MIKSIRIKLIIIVLLISLYIFTKETGFISIAVGTIGIILIDLKDLENVIKIYDKEVEKILKKGVKL